MAAIKADPARSLLQRCCKALDDKKAVELRVLDVSSQSSITNYLIIGTATSSPHLKALRMAIEEVLKDAHAPLAGIEFGADSGWMVVDAYEFMAHFFLPDQRDNYRLETLWRDAHEIDVRELLAGKK
jgi:ribosome-associated protein